MRMDPDGWIKKITDALPGAVIKSILGALIIQIIVRLMKKNDKQAFVDWGGIRVLIFQFVIEYAFRDWRPTDKTVQKKKKLGAITFLEWKSWMPSNKPIIIKSI